MNMSSSTSINASRKSFASKGFANVLLAIAATIVAAPLAQSAELAPPDLIAAPTVGSNHAQVAQNSGSESKTSKAGNEIQTPSCRNAKLAVLSIIDFVLQNAQGATTTQMIRVSAQSYSLVLQELQNRQASFLAPGAKAPTAARAVFKLETEDPGLCQTVYFN